ncbi:nucleoside-diphosphate sugar epimerase/dehydratase [Brevundimonas sp.]|uniref:polysaccharide biosynthesis protein n=1 Tax=Brevundimonas sp. TaxID=1871086 RepID=UPI002D373211|nr:nucleoside-diphosphate sugar epimerase/dehydratase [Brevundimonas sp.]HYC67390.1 nucleoside-diphosphate sugar epimerase/dehydratase [Brevundimonas sp.]
MMGNTKTARARLTLAWTAKFCLHISLLFVGLVLAYELRRALPLEWWVTSPDAVRVLRWAGLYALIGAGVELVFQSERSAWRFASMREVIGLVRNVTVTSGLFLGVIFFLDRGLQLPRSVLPLTWLVSIALLVGFRMAWRLPHDPGLAAHFLPSWWPRPQSDRTPMLIVGPMSGADRQIRLIQGDEKTPYQIIGVVTPHREEVGLRLHGVPFISDLKTWVPAQSGLTVRGVRPHAIVFLDDPVQAYGFSTERIGELRRAGHRLLKPQSLAEIDGSDGAAQKLEEIPLEDFLPRKPISLDATPVRNLIAGRRVLVTGAGGSIGSEICRQLLSFGCSHLSMVDHSEFLLFEIDRELAGVNPAASRRAILANVRDETRIREVFAAERPDIVFHAAALKHVTLVENNPAEGVLTNVLGTWNVMRAAVAADADQFVLISTDKAVDPTNVMGATKRIAEALLETAPEGRTRLAAVRFGNVLGSAGSVVPIFRDQIARGGPVTVTHPDVNRYFMTIPEAVQLVLHSTAVKAARAGAGPSKFLLEMGEPVKIADLARQMIELSGKRPDIDIAIEYTGLKKGEKIAEELADAGEDTRPGIEGILEVLSDFRGVDTALLDELIATARGGRDRDVAAQLSAIVQDIRGRLLTPVDDDQRRVAP